VESQNQLKTIIKKKFISKNTPNPSTHSNLLVALPKSTYNQPVATTNTSLKASSFLLLPQQQQRFGLPILQ
jgi:hypothetical protein